MKSATLFGTNIAGLLEAQGKTKTALAAFCDVSQPSVSDWCSGKTKNIEGRHLVKAAEFFGVSASALLNEEIDTSIKAQEPAATYSTPVNRSITRTIPVVGLLQLQQDSLLVVAETKNTKGLGMAVFPSDSNTNYAVGVAGDYLRPRFKPGESMIVDPAKKTEPGHEVFVKLTDGRVLVAVLDWTRTDLVQFSDVNESGKPFTVSSGEIESMHRIVGHAHADMHVY